MTTTTQENPNEAPENNEKVKKNQTEVEKIIKGKVETFVEGRLDENLFYFRDFKTTPPHNNPELFDCFKEYLRNETSVYPDLKDNLEGSKHYCLTLLNKISLIESQKRILIFKNTKKVFTDEFNFELHDKNNLFDFLKKEDISRLKILGLSSSERLRYLRKKLRFSEDKISSITNGESEKLDEKFLDTVFKNISNIDEIKKDEKLMITLKKLSSVSRIDFDEFQYFLNAIGEKNKEAKLAALKYFMPKISVEDACKVLFSTQRDIDNFKKKVLKDLMKDKITDTDLEALLKEIDFSVLFLDTRDGNFLKEDDLEKLIASDKIIQKIVKEYNTGSEILSSEFYIETLEGLYEGVDSTDKIRDEIKSNIKNFKEGNYINITVKTKDGKNISKYYFIEKFYDNKFILVDITKRDGRILSLENGTKEEKKFHDFYKNLLGISSNNNSSISFLKSEEFSRKKENGEIIEDLESKNQISKEELKSILDEIDPDGTGVDLQKMAFIYKDENDDDDKENYAVEDNLVIVDRIDDNFVHIRGQGTMGLKEFVDAFKDVKAKRFKRADNPKDFLENMQEEELHKKSLEGFKIEGDKIVPKNYSGVGKGVEYFTGENGGEAVRITSLGNGFVDFEFGKFEMADEDDEKGKNIFTSKKVGKGFDYNSFYLFLKDKELKPYTKNIKTDEKEEKIEEFKPKRSFLSFWWNNFLTASDLVDGGRQVVDSIENSLKRKSKLKSAKMANFIGKKIPIDSIRTDTQNLVESETKKAMEDYMGVLKSKNTGDLINTVENYLIHGRPDDPELEASLMTIISKYHILYPKGLKKYNGKFMWYQALGGKIGDKIYNRYEKKCENEGHIFTEEYLVEELLADQAARGIRRHRFDKDYGKYRNDGLNDELADGEEKTKNKSSMEARVEYCMGEFKGLGFANGVGGLENIWAKGPGNAHLMNAVPFVILASEMSMNFTPPLIQKTRGYGYETPFTCLSLIGSKKEINMYNDFVLRTIELMGDDDMFNSFKKIRSTKDRATKIDLSYEFWKKYGKKLYPKINLNDGFVVSRMNEPGNEKLKEFYEKLKGVHFSDGFKNGISDEKYLKVGYLDAKESSVAATGGLLKKKISIGDGGKMKTPAGKKIFYMYLDYFKDFIVNGKYIASEGERKKLFKETYKKIERHMYSEISGFLSRGKPEAYKNFTCVMEARGKGIEFFPDSFEDEKGTFLKEKYDNILEKKRQEFKDGELFPKEDGVLEETEEVKETVDELLSSGMADDYNRANTA